MIINIHLKFGKKSSSQKSEERVICDVVKVYAKMSFYVSIYLNMINKGISRLFP